ncbi:lysis protein [Laribacter hongkongensis]|uniref:Lysis protein n=1 Tax=Laribacter hongkongensis TaxID=168471 RepID=A0ABD4SUJ1_9NEIS|nr:lysis system i-spanin subunit Rz [Laribacter hongkongensis]MCG9026309.1 lysis protein [Laribacter hongkongensis]MCG9099345.1 lysis protein [Laribacter hongkongensis]MCG9102431.1 lysis protein [Laribacter hongkongensis]MCG9111900.1 lysis protein [Laribacter hongkongensis]MCG9118947.1 lysis protein [Laribacter hongkongensis]
MSWPRIAAALAGLVALLLAAVGIYRAGAGSVQVRWNAAVADAERRQSAALLEARERERERRQALAMSELEKSYLESQRHAEKQSADLRRQLRTGTVRLSVPVDAGACGVSENDPAAGSCDAAPRADIPAAVADDLVAIADDADDTVRQLTACQAVVSEYLK